MNKGIIMDVKKNYAIALNDNGVMDKISYKPNMEVGRKIFYFEEDILIPTANKTHRHNNFLKAFGSVAALFLLVFTFFNTMKIDNAYAIISLDINPSIQIEADSEQRIIKVEGINDDGKKIDFSDIKDIPFDDGIEKIKEKLEDKNYLESNKEVLVGYAFIKNGDNSEYEDDLKDAIQSTFNTEKVTYVIGDKEAVSEAKSKGISLGRYEASIMADEETKNRIDKAPVKDITSSIKDKENVEQWEAKDAEIIDMPAKNSKPEISSEKPAIKTPTINVPADKALPNNDANKEKDDIKKPQKGEELELEPEKPVQTEKDNKPKDNKASNSDSITIAPNNGTIENNTTSGKIQGNSNELTLEPTKPEGNSANNETKK